MRLSDGSDEILDESFDTDHFERGAHDDQTVGSFEDILVGSDDDVFALRMRLVV